MNEKKRRGPVGNFVKSIDCKTVLDYGAGVGWFRAFRPQDVVVDSYDLANYPQTGVKHVNYDLICFWDVLEHIPNFKEIEVLLHNTKYVVVSLPIKPKRVHWKKWKHFKPREHLHYFTIESLDTLFENYKFKKVKSGYPECKPKGPRIDIYTALYKKCEN